MKRRDFLKMAGVLPLAGMLVPKTVSACTSEITVPSAKNRVLPSYSRVYRIYGTMRQVPSFFTSSATSEVQICEFFERLLNNRETGKVPYIVHTAHVCQHMEPPCLFQLIGENLHATSKPLPIMLGMGVLTGTNGFWNARWSNSQGGGHIASNAVHRTFDPAIPVIDYPAHPEFVLEMRDNRFDVEAIEVYRHGTNECLLYENGEVTPSTLAFCDNWFRRHGGMERFRRCSYPTYLRKA